MRNRYLTDPTVLNAIGDLHRSLAAEQARAIGLLDPNRGGSWTHPSLDRLLHADGKVITPLFRAKPGDTRVDKQTGEIISLRHEPDAALHFEGDGMVATGRDGSVGEPPDCRSGAMRTVGSTPTPPTGQRTHVM